MYGSDQAASLELSGMQNLQCPLKKCLFQLDNPAWKSFRGGKTNS